MNLFGRKKADAAPPKPKECECDAFSFFVSLFNNRRASALAAVSPEEISAKVAELTTMRETIEKKQAHIERQSTLIAQQAIARSKLGDKRGALLLVKKKKMHDVEAQKFNGSAYPVHTGVAFQVFYVCPCAWCSDRASRQADRRLEQRTAQFAVHGDNGGIAGSHCSDPERREP